MKLKLENSPVALDCRKLLGDLQAVNEKRKGRHYLVLIYMLLTAPGILLIVKLGANFYYEVSTLVMHSYTAITGTGLLFAVIYLICLEQSLCTQNKKNLFQDYIGKKLNQGENMITYQVARAYSLTTPNWMPDDVSHYFYFAFTTDRLLVFCFKNHIQATDQIENSLESYDFDYIISSVFTFPLSDKSKIKIGGFLKSSNPFENLIHIKITASPVDEPEHYTWALTDRFSQNGKLFKRIRERLNNGYSQEI